MFDGLMNNMCSPDGQTLKKLDFLTIELYVCAYNEYDQRSDSGLTIPRSALAFLLNFQTDGI